MFKLGKNVVNAVCLCATGGFQFTLKRRNITNKKHMQAVSKTLFTSYDNFLIFGEKKRKKKIQKLCFINIYILC